MNAPKERWRSAGDKERKDRMPKKILLFMMDQQRAEYVGYAENGCGAVTPNIDRIAAHVHFTNYQTTNPICTPARWRRPPQGGLHHGPLSRGPDDLGHRLRGGPAYHLTGCVPGRRMV